LTFSKIGFVLQKNRPICTCGRARTFSTAVEQTMAASATANRGIFDFYTVILHFDF